jgi:hypothetical protein
MPPAAFGAPSVGSSSSAKVAPEEVHKVHTRVNLGTSEAEVHTRFTPKFLSRIRASVNLVNLVNLFHPYACARMHARDERARKRFTGFTRFTKPWKSAGFSV